MNYRRHFCFNHSLVDNQSIDFFLCYISAIVIMNMCSILFVVTMVQLPIVYWVSANPLVAKDKCLWHNDTCVKQCPDWMVVTKSDCSKTYWNSQKTCDQPEETLVGTVCGFSRCDCPDGLALDVTTGVCYDVDNCPTNHSEETE